MEGNRDESERCLQRAEAFLKTGDLEKAIKFAEKAARLFPSKKAEALIAAINSANGSAASEGEWESEASAAASEASGAPKGSPGADGRARERGARHRHASAEAPVQRTFTKEQQEAVQKVLKCKDYYEILAVEKTCTDEDIKRAYKKLALKLHPDKNHAPGATEAFKAISKAFGTLSDPIQRRKYDEYGIAEEQTSVRYRRTGKYGNDYSDYDNDDVFADELFRMFFGGNFQREPPRRRPSQRRPQTNSRPHHHHNAAHSEQQSENPYSLLLQISPLVFLVALSLLSTLLIGDPPYSLQQSSKFNVVRLTERLSVQYFVKSDFKSNYGDQIGSIDRQVEDEYLRNLQQNCYREKAHRENNMWRARMYNNEHLYEQAKSLKTPSCDRLVKMSSGR